MFTGLIQALGTVKPLGGDSWQITCVTQAETMMLDLAYGDSVAVDGVCLTVEEVSSRGFTATASPETLRRTTLGMDSPEGKYVNLETSLRVGGKVGGHFVMGHVDGVGQLVAAEKTATSWEMTFTAPEAIARYLVPKGSIAINGISLTVANYNHELSQFTVAVIPITYSDTNLRHLLPGSWVNLEGDILGKYVEKFLNPRKATESSVSDSISLAFLAENGYL
ncbi:riboflavin synthase [Calothrix sp. 336/3]|uniref:riboflavin synthase n=1 Tax=Calothrix sp. 336/3 TaxID=1337936 RepID=UPI0004E42A11|nr:riboflavin synthase [Calothrix sp. 336/3]AKG23103.1 riboflavin synthase subunit alpha [Calothrix sp. 336/3]